MLKPILIAGAAVALAGAPANAQLLVGVNGTVNGAVGGTVAGSLSGTLNGPVGGVYENRIHRLTVGRVTFSAAL